MAIITIDINNFPEIKLPEKELIPDGWYTAYINSADVVETLKKDGRYLNLEFMITQDPYKDRRLFQKINLWVSSPKARFRAQEEAKALYNALGFTKTESTSQLLDKVISINIGHQVDSRPEHAGKIRNVIEGFEKAAANAPKVENNNLQVNFDDEIPF